MNIALINNLYEPYERGGAERVCKLQKKGLEEQGHQVSLISLSPSDVKTSNENGLFYIKSSFSNLGAMPKWRRLIWHLVDTFNFFKFFQINRILLSKKVDLVITHNLTGLGKINAFFISKKYKHIHVLHDINLLHPSGLMFLGEEGVINTFFAKGYQLIIRQFFNNTFAVISPSKWLLDLHLEKKYFSRIKTAIIENPVNLDHDYIKEEKNDFTFIYVGLIEKHKGIDVLIEAWNLAQNSIGQKCVLKIVGDLVCDDYLVDLKKMPNTQYYGKLSHDELLVHLSEADCLIAPSVCYENSPTVLYEAASFGTSIIASNIGGSKETSLKLEGIVFEAGNRFSLQEKIIFMASSKEMCRKKGDQSRQLVKKYNLESYMDRLRDLIN